MSTFWSGWVIFLTLLNLALVIWVLVANQKVTYTADAEEDEYGIKTGHVYDGIEEYDNPLPGWWFNLFVITLVFTAIYLLLFPGLGNFKGLLGWSSVGQWEESVAKAEAKYAPLFEQYAGMPLPEIAEDPDALKMGQRIFSNNCAVCHGSDGRGSYGFPNLADDAWQWGGSPEQILASIKNGRQAAMPGWGQVIGEQGVINVTEYTFQLAGREHDAAKAEQGKSVYMQNCVACHGAEGKGNVALGAPDLTDDVWLYGGSPVLVRHSVRAGRQGKMPAQDDLLKPEKIRLVSAYVWSLSRFDLEKAD